jgi:hypothetical protein
MAHHLTSQLSVNVSFQVGMSYQFSTARHGARPGLQVQSGALWHNMRHSHTSQHDANILLLLLATAAAIHMCCRP